MFRKLYNWMLEKSASKEAPWFLALISFAESSFFPLPPDLMLVPMCLADRKKSFQLAAICTIASVIGALAGYAIGYFLYESVGQWILNVYGGADGWYEKTKTLFDQYGAWIILVKGLTPIPFKILTILSGMLKFSLPIFIGTCIVTRGGRFFIVAGLLYFYGDKARTFLDKHLEPVLMVLFVLIIGGFALVKFVI